MHSMQCEITLWIEPTKPENVSRVERVLKASKREHDIRSYLLSSDYAESWAGTTYWYRKGEKERLEVHRGGRNPYVETTAFDGQIVRTLTTRDDEVMGSINDIVGAHWKSSQRKTPFGFLFEFAMEPFSEVLAAGREYRIDRELTDTGGWIIRFRHPTSDARWFRLVIDDEFRIIARDNIFRFSKDQAPRVSQRFKFRNYERFLDASGEPLWLPTKVVIDLCCGELDGVPVVYGTEHYELNDVKINPALTDDLFVISFPRGAEVWDGLSGVGFIQQDVTATAAVGTPTDPAARPVPRRWWRVAIVVAGLLALVMALGGFRMWWSKAH